MIMVNTVTEVVGRAQPRDSRHAQQRFATELCWMVLGSQISERVGPGLDRVEGSKVLIRILKGGVPDKARLLRRRGLLRHVEAAERA